MNRSLCVSVLLLCFTMMVSAAAQIQSHTWCRISPERDARYVPAASTLLLRSDKKIEHGITARDVRIVVNGKISGGHPGRTVIADDRETVIFTPDLPFSPDESVSVRVEAGAACIPPLDYHFTVSAFAHYDERVWAGTTDIAPGASIAAVPEAHSAMSVINGVAVPADFPKFTASTLKGTAPGKIFIGNWSMSGDRHYMMILENDGTPYFYKRLPGAHARDFKIQPTGTLTRRVYDDLNCFVEMDSQYVNIDTIRCGNGYGTDEHELQLLPNHHALLIGLDYHQVDMSKLISGGATNATVIGNTVQELDERHRVVFEWRSWDNFNITDAVHENLKGGTIDYVHMNSIAVDYDSNLVISSRHLSEVTKINRKTGKIIWRLGGAHNQFRFANDLYQNSYQHDVRPVPGKPNAYTMMDNGNFHSPSFSRAVEFQLDTAQMVAIKTWEYRHTPADYYTYFMGNVQRLPNGNTFIDWGDAPVPKATEVTAAGEVVYEANFDKSGYSYRDYRFNWQSVVKIPYLVAEPYPDKITLIFNKFGDKRVKRYIVYCGTSPAPTTPIDSTAQTWIDLTNLTNNRTYYFRVTARDSSGVESPYSNEENLFVKIYPPNTNQVINGDFFQGLNGWSFIVANGGAALTTTGADGITIAIGSGGSQSSSIQLFEPGIGLVNGKQYLFEFDAFASNSRTIDARVEQNGGSGTNYSKTGTLALTKNKTHKAYPFTMTSANDFSARVTFNVGVGTDTVHLNNISVQQVVTTAVAASSIAPILFRLEQNYPNPFNPSTTISFQLPNGEARYTVALDIFDMLGRKAATLVNEEKTSGTYSVQWNAAGFASGLYYCMLRARTASGSSSMQAVKKILLIK